MLAIHFTRLGIIGILVAIFTGCTGPMRGEVYLEREPHLKLENFFNGDLRAWGIIQDRQGTVLTRFTADIDASWDGDNGLLNELFTYQDSGKQQKRVWKINKLNDSEYRGKANDVIGVASGKQFGNAVYWTYEMNVPFKGSEYRVKFEDWLWSMDDEVVFNRSYIKKFGIKVAEVTIFMQKQDSEAPAGNKLN